MKKHNNRKLSVIASFLIFSLLLCFFAGCDLVLDPPEGEETKLQKEYCTATIDEDFKGDAVTIQLFPEYENVEYKVEDFIEVGCISIYERWRAKDDHMKKLTLTLDIDSKENVLEMIKILEKREDIYRAYPSYVDHVEAIPSGYNAHTSPQWAISRIDLPDAWDINTGLT